MTSLSLTYYQRVMLWNLIGATNAPSLKEASVYLRVMEKIRLTDQEATESQFFSENGTINWKLPKPDYGSGEFRLEEGEAKALMEVIEKASPIRVLDAEWLERLVEQCRSNTLAAQ